MKGNILKGFFCSKIFVFLITLLVICTVAIGNIYAEKTAKRSKNDQKILDEIKELINERDQTKKDKIHFKKKLRPEKDIEYLYNLFDLSNKLFIPKTKRCLDMLDCNGTRLDKQKVILKKISNCEVKVCQKLHIDEDEIKIEIPIEEIPIECKLEEIEEKLGLKYDNNSTLKNRIGNIYDELQYKDWDKDRIQFGIIFSHLVRLQTLSAGVAVNAYPAYLKHTPGSWFNEKDLFRRLSAFFALGIISISDTSNEITGITLEPSLTSGLSLDITQGFNVSLGWSIYRGTDSISLSVTLISDFLNKTIKSW